MNEVINYNTELLALLENEEDDDNLCLIDGTPLQHNCIELRCKHKFNYLSILQEFKIQKNINTLEVQKLKNYQVKCPYCRSIQEGVLPYRENEFPIKLKGINWPPSKVFKNKKCMAILKSGKNKGQVCGKFCCGEYCPRHQKIIEKNAAKKQKNNASCIGLIKQGKRKGELCGCKCLKNQKYCGRHIEKKSIK